MHPAVLQFRAQPFIAVPDQGLDFERTVGGIELNILEQALKKTHGNKFTFRRSPLSSLRLPLRLRASA